MIPGDLNVNNVVVLVGDAVRWDHAVDRCSSLGRTAKTVSASLHTPTSFATMLTGRHPIQHGVYGFSERVSADVDSLFSVSEVDAGYGRGYVNDWVCNRQQVVGQQPQRELAEMEPPFAWVTRDAGGHAPYNGFRADGQTLEGPNAKEYLMENAGNLPTLREDYRNGVEAFLDRVDRVLDELADRGILDETLVVVTSDHGELLGEYGQIGHDFPATPELVYVPTTFVHPAIEPGVEEDGVARHVDLLPTLLDCLGHQLPSELPGRSLRGADLPRRGISDYHRSFEDFIEVGVRSLPGGDLVPTEALPNARIRLLGVWDCAGGYVKSESSTFERGLLLALRAFASPEGRHAIRSGTLSELRGELTPGVHRYGQPETEPAEGRRVLESYRSLLPEGGRSTDLDEQALEQLEQLGYV